MRVRGKWHCAWRAASKNRSVRLSTPEAALLMDLYA
jgi:hypothetical protein